MFPEFDYLQVHRRVRFPVYILSSENVYFEDGLLFLNGKVLDDTNQAGNSLGTRRLQTPHLTANIGKAILSFIGLINCKSTKFIDSKGFCFSYIKTKICNVESRKITRKISKGTHTVILAKGINCSFSMDYYPHAEEWAQILMLDGLPWKLLSVSEKEAATFKRKI